MAAITYSGLPDRIADVEMLDSMLSEPTEGVVEALAKLEGDILILGCAGKMGPSLTMMAKRASDMAGVKRRVIGVSLFASEQELREEKKLQAMGIETIHCDFLDQEQLKALPEVKNIMFMAGMKFGSTGAEALTWAINTFLPGLVCKRFCNSRIVAFSSGNIYGLTPAQLGGPTEKAVPNPMGEYAISVLGRERMFEFYSKSLSIPVSIMRLNYAVEMRYGVLVDIAQTVFDGRPFDVTMANANVIWQGDANAMALRLFENASTPPFILNVVGPEMLSLRQVAMQFGELMGKKVEITGAEAPEVLISNGQLGHRLYGYPRVGLQQMLIWIADWVSRGGESLGKPTHFEVRDGKF